jgi:DNA polymerase (family 10)
MLDNATLAELLCRAAEADERTPQQRRALRRAGRAAFRWPVEASELARADRPLTELRWVGPWMSRMLAGWLEHPPPIEPPPPIRRQFLTRTEADRLLGANGSHSAVRGDLQLHTAGSDGTASVRDMALAARLRGLEYIAVTDHSKGLAIANGMDEQRLARQGMEIAALNEELKASGFRVLRAVEMNLSPAGEGDLDRAFLGRLDIVLGAFHSRLRVTDDQTERYLAALERGSFHVLAHPRGRIYDFRLGLTADWRRVFACAREHGCAIEIDGYPDRQDLDVDLLQIARDEGTMISIGSDAHATDQLAFLDFGIAAARRAGVPDAQILNCMTADRLVAWTAARRSAGVSLH